MAAVLPIAQSFAESGRKAIKAAITSSIAPRQAANCRTERKRYIQPIKGALGDHGVNPMRSDPSELHEGKPHNHQDEPTPNKDGPSALTWACV